ncbi:MAG: CHASE2 domain-containing protein [Polymorphobacter sp.]|uniref:CHASE2 domain-containing protein n=1 Tax=Polymorphobacter sp. TaxID=1909290 RepID=UPI003A85652F
MNDLLRPVRRFLDNVGLGRLLVTLFVLLAAVGIARFSWQLPVLVETERGLYDVRHFLTAPVVAQDPRIAIVVFTEETLAATGKRSPLDRKLLADALRSIDTMGARSIGIDILIDQAQPEDDYLVETFKAMKTPTRLATVAEDEEVPTLPPWQDEFLRAFQARIATDKVGGGDVRVDVDADNYIRRFPAQLPGAKPLLMDLMAADAGWGGTPMRDYKGGIAFRRAQNDEEPVFTMLPIDLFANPALAEAMAPLIEGRLVLIGADLSMVDRFETPLTRVSGQDTPGVAIHGHLLAQRLDSRQLLLPPGWSFWAAALLVVMAGAFTSISPLPTAITAAIGGIEVVGLLGLPPLLQWSRVDTIGLPAGGWVIGFIIAYAATAASARSIGVEQREFAQSALGKYLPPDIAQMILREPEKLALHGEKRQIFALFTDIEGFTKLSDSLQAEELSVLLNAYLDDISRIILAHGGTIDKFVGDAVIAFWGAPVARPDDGERALAAARAIQAYSAEQMRKNENAAGPRIGRTRIGVHRGKAVVGNFGGTDRIQYTALGDAMNTAARLEAANKATGSYTMISREALTTVRKPVCRSLGRIMLRGRGEPIEVYEPVEDETAATEHNALWKRFEAGDAAALQAFRILAAAHPDDKILAKMVSRLETLEPGGYYVVS